MNEYVKYMLTTGADTTCANLINKGVDGCFTISYFLKTVSYLENKLIRALIFTYRLRQNVRTVKSYCKTGTSLAIS